MTSKVIVFTGATNGLGLCSAKQLAKEGHRLILVARSETRGEALINTLMKISPNSEVKHSLYIGDMSNMNDVKRIALKIQADVEKIDILINNVGAVFKNYKETSDGIDVTIALNYLATFIFTLNLKRSLHPGSRVVNTSSQTHSMVHFNPNDMNAKKAFNGFTRYARSKLYNILFTRLLAQKWEKDGIQVNCFHPGLVSTGFGSGELGIFAPISWFSYKTGGISAEQGGTNLTYMATSKDLDGITGAYYDQQKRAQPSKDAQNDDYAATRWQQSLKWANMEE